LERDILVLAGKKKRKSFPEIKNYEWSLDTDILVLAGNREKKKFSSIIIIIRIRIGIFLS
jgi:hypothetical protein